MATISAAQVKALRDKTGAGMMECKKALQEADGDMDRAGELLRERGIVKAGKRAGRTTSEGRIAAALSPDGRIAALVEVNCETDFVAKTDDYAALCVQLAESVIQKAPADLDALLDGRGSAVTAAIAKLGENIQVRRFERVEATSSGAIATYIHAGGKIGALVEVEADDPGSDAVKALAHNLCMHVAAINPSSVSRDDLSPALVESERRVLTAQAEGEGKKPEIAAKMVEGRLNKYFKEVVLLEQPLVMDPDQTVGAAAKAAGARVRSFRRFQLGEELDA